MFNQSLPAQLLRMLVALLLALVLVHNCPPLLKAMAQNATEGGCHQGDGSAMQHHDHQHHGHNHDHKMSHQ